jgi:hypothetical protein
MAIRAAAAWASPTARVTVAILLQTPVTAGARQRAAPRYPEFVMPGSARKIRAPAPPAAHAPARQAGSVYDSHAADLYRQALLTLGNPSLAEQVVMGVIVDACMQDRKGDVDAGAAASRLAVETYWRCQELARKRGRRNWSGIRLVRARTAGVTGAGTLSVQERGALGLVLFGGLECVQASRELAIPPRDLAAILRRALSRLAVPAAASLSSAST